MTASGNTPEPEANPTMASGDVAESDLITVRLSIRPDQDLRVSPAEHLDLEAQGLLVKSSQKNARLRPALGKE